MLTVPDNAVNAAQVMPLLPGSASCTVPVTSRRQLTGLVTAYGAHSLQPDMLPEADARQLLACRLHPDQLTADPAAVTDCYPTAPGYRWL
jgi:hypothetical protein